MPLNKLALIRYKTIDHCLQNRYRKWTLEDLIEACNDALYEYEGITTGVSKRTIQLDLQNMRSSKLGYNAPIVITDKKYYTYDQKNFSITNIPLSSQDLNTLNEVLEILKQFRGFGYFQELNSMVTRLEDKIYKQQNRGKSFIDFEKNELLKGLEQLDPLHFYIRSRQVLEIQYQSFKAEVPQQIIFYPYLLKEFRNRWFLLGCQKKGMSIMILALDRIVSFEPHPREKYRGAPMDVHSYFQDVIGVSKMPNQKPQLIVMKVSKLNAPYVLTKPLHPTQTVLKEENGELIFSINVIWNFELEREILGFGEDLKVLSPKRLAGKIYARHKKAFELYQQA